MKKLLIVLGVLAGLGLIGVLVMAFFLGNIVTAGVNRFAPQITQTNVTLGSAAISPFSGQGTLNNLVVSNPKGWSDAKLCSIGKIHIDVEPFSVLHDHIVVNELVIEQPEFLYETKVIASNVSDLIKNIDQATGGGKDSTQATAKNGQPIKIVVKKLVVQNGRVTLGLGPTAFAVPLPPITLTDLGTAENGITPGGLALAVMRAVTPNIVAASMSALGKAGGTTGAAAIEGAKQIGEGIKGLFGGDKKKP